MYENYSDYVELALPSLPDLRASPPHAVYIFSAYSDIACPDRHVALSSGALLFHTPLSLSVGRRRVFERTTARVIGTLRKLTISGYSCFHLTASKAARRRSAVLTFLPGNPSIEYTRGQKSRCLSLQALPHLSSFSFSAFARTFADERLL